MLPAGPQLQRISEDIPDRRPQRISENIRDKTQMVRKYVKKCRLVVLTRNNLFRRLSKIGLRRHVGLCAHHRHQQQRKRHQAFELGFFLVTHFAPIHIYNQTTLRTKSLYTEQFLRAGILTQRGLCTETLL